MDISFEQFYLISSFFEIMNKFLIQLTTSCNIYPCSLLSHTVVKKALFLLFIKFIMKERIAKDAKHISRKRTLWHKQCICKPWNSGWQEDVYENLILKISSLPQGSWFLWSHESIPYLWCRLSTWMLSKSFCSFLEISALKMNSKQLIFALPTFGIWNVIK